MSLLKISSFKLYERVGNFFIFNVVVRLRRGKNKRKFVKLKFINFSDKMGYNNDILLFLLFNSFNTSFNNSILGDVKRYNKNKLEKFFRRVDYKEKINNEKKNKGLSFEGLHSR